MQVRCIDPQPNGSAASRRVGTKGAGSGAYLGPGLDLWDLSAIKNIALGDRARLQFRGEFFNAFNHTNYSSVQSATDASNFGQVNGTHDPREIQLGGKFTF
jgi:hypothetical protein